MTRVNVFKGLINFHIIIKNEAGRSVFKVILNGLLNSRHFVASLRDNYVCVVEE
jgi:hypothetical protein